MKRHWLVLAGGIGALTLVASVGQVAAGAAGKPHSDQVITVTKTAAGSGAPLGGAVFTLYKWHGTCDFSSVVATATSNSAGVATFNLEGHHNYCVVETTPPAGYLLPTTGPVVVKTAHSTNSKGTDDPANVKESATVAFVDTAQAVAPTATTTTTTTPTTPTTTATPATPATPSTAGTAGAGGASSGSEVSGATTVHTGEPWKGSTPYALGALLAGCSLVGAGLFARRRVLH